MRDLACFLDALLIAGLVAGCVSVTGGPAWACVGFFFTVYFLKISMFLSKKKD